MNSVHNRVTIPLSLAKVILLLTLPIFCWPVPPHLEVTWLNVGQGDAAMAMVKHPTRRNPQLIVDSGTTSNVASKNRVVDATIELLNRDMEKEKAIEESPDLYVVVTHGDKDHLFFLTDILKKYRTVENRHLAFKFLLGGKKSHYKSGEARNLYKYLTNKLKINKEDFLVEAIIGNNNSPRNDNWPLYQNPGNGNPEASLSFLATLAVDNKNACSIVSKLTYGSTHVLFTGDAIGDTYDAIHDHLLPAPEATTLLHVSHHGADSNGSNSIVWLNRVRAKFFACSSGTTYNHPNFRTVKNIAGTYAAHYPQGAANNIFANGHVVQCSTFEALDVGTAPIEHAGNINDNYTWCRVRCPFYSTLVHGNLKFKFDSEGNCVEYPALVINPD